MRRFLKFIGKQLLRLFHFLKRGLIGIPKKTIEQIYQFADWGKRQLDKRINSAQRERLHTLIFKSDTPGRAQI